MRIDWELSERQPDPRDPLGTITIVGTDGGIIQAVAKHLDTWFIALLQGIETIREGSQDALEPLEEPDPLEFERIGDYVLISQNLARLIAGPVEEVELVVRREAGKFLKQMKTDPRWKASEALLAMDVLLEE